MKNRIFAPIAMGLLLTSCGFNSDGQARNGDSDHGSAETGHDDTHQTILLDTEQIRMAGITTARPSPGGGVVIDIPAMIEGDPEAVQVVSATFDGRIVSLSGNLGNAVRRGQVLAVLESPDAARLKGDAEAARARLQLANTNLAREERLFAERVSAKQDLIAARTVATEARIAWRQASEELSATGLGGGTYNRLAIASPLSGHVIMRSVALGQLVNRGTELFRVGNLTKVSLTMALQPADAGQIQPGTVLTVKAPGRQSVARIRYISPALDDTTRLVPVVAELDNRDGKWRIGEPVTASLQLTVGSGPHALSVPSAAVQTIDGQPVVFVRTPTGFRAAKVTTGPISEENIVILTGISAADEIATTNSFTLKAELGKGEAGHEH